MTNTWAADAHTASGLLGRVRRLGNSELIARSASDPSIRKTIAWWEDRRVPYNLLVGATGLVSGAMCLITGTLCEYFVGDPIGIPDPPFFALLGVAAYALMANLCYTGGWMAEILVEKIWPGKGNEFGRISFFLGLVFSILLTLVPGILASTVGTMRLLEYFVGK